MKKITSTNCKDTVYTEAQVMEYFEKEVCMQTLGHNVALKIMSRPDISQESRDIIINFYKYDSRICKFLSGKTLNENERYILINEMSDKIIEKEKHCNSYLNMRWLINNSQLYDREIIFVANKIYEAHGDCGLIDLWPMVKSCHNIDRIKNILLGINNIKIVVEYAKYSRYKFNSNYKKYEEFIHSCDDIAGKRDNEKIDFPAIDYINFLTEIFSTKRTQIIEWSLKSAERMSNILTQYSWLMTEDEQIQIVDKLVKSKKEINYVYNLLDINNKSYGFHIYILPHVADKIIAKAVLAKLIKN